MKTMDAIRQTSSFYLEEVSWKAVISLLLQSRNRLQRKYIIVGGVGHTTEALRQLMQQELPSLSTKDLSEAELFSAYIQEKYNLTVCTCILLVITTSSTSVTTSTRILILPSNTKT